jgi:hypothetical protein
MLKPKPKKPRLKAFRNNWPKLKKIVKSRRPAKKLLNGGRSGWRKILRSSANPRKYASKNSWIAWKNLKNSFAKVGAYSSEENFIWGDPKGVIEWISEEAEAFEEILNDRGDICSFSGARGVAAILKKAGCEHVKAVAQVEAAFSVDDTKDPSTEATLVGGKFYSDVWVNGGRELANEIIKKNEKDTYDAREEARRTEEAAERERRIGIVFEF